MIQNNLDNNILDTLPKFLDYNELEYSNPIHLDRSLFEYYHTSMISIVNESHFNEKKNSFPTDKIFKPIAARQAFIVLSNGGYLKDLRSMGYRTFSPFIDESYDLIDDDEERIVAIIDDDEERIVAIIDELTRLSKLSYNERLEFLRNVEEIVEYNFNVLMDKKIFYYGDFEL